MCVIIVDVKKIIFVCHGNICRSPVAELLFNELIKGTELENKYIGESYALSSEEEGNDIYPPMRRIIEKEGYLNYHHYASKITSKSFLEAEMIFYMDEENKSLIERFYPLYLVKCHLISEYRSGINEIEDPWYTNRFEKVYEEIKKSVEGIITSLLKESKILR